MRMPLGGPGRIQLSPYMPYSPEMDGSFMSPRHLFTASATICLLLGGCGVPGAAAQTVDQRQYANRPLLPDPSARPCPDQPRTLTPVRGNLYRHTAGAGLAVHSGFVLITPEGALVIDPAMTCTAIWLKQEIITRFRVPVKYVIYTHAHFDHIAGGQIFQVDGAVVIAQRNALEPIVGEQLPTAVPNQLFEHDRLQLMRMSLDSG